MDIVNYLIDVVKKGSDVDEQDLISSWNNSGPDLQRDLVELGSIVVSHPTDTWGHHISKLPSITKVVPSGTNLSDVLAVLLKDTELGKYLSMLKLFNNLNQTNSNENKDYSKFF